MSIETLQQIGLSLNEAKIYEALLDLKEAGVSGISAHTKIHRRNAYDAIKRLIAKGLVFSVLGKGENMYSPVDPGKCLELIKEKEADFLKIMPELEKKYHQRRGKQEAYIYRGIEGFKNYMRDILKTGEDTYFIGGKLIWLDAQLKTFSEQFFKEAKRKNIKFQGVFDAEVKNNDEEALKNFSKPHKFLPPEHSTGSALIIFGDYVVTYTGLKLRKMDKHITVFVLRDKNLAESYKEWFKFVYKKCST